MGLAVARAPGISGESLTGREFQRLDHQALAERMPGLGVLARASPERKLRASRGGRFPDGITTSQSFYAATPSSSQSARALFPPRPPGRVETVRSASRPERHFADSFITVRLARALFLATWLPRCPFCHQPHTPSRCSIDRFTRAA